MNKTVCRAQYYQVNGMLFARLYGLKVYALQHQIKMLQENSTRRLVSDAKAFSKVSLLAHFPNLIL